MNLKGFYKIAISPGYIQENVEIIPRLCTDYAHAGKQKL